MARHSVIGPDFAAGVADFAVEGADLAVEVAGTVPAV
jgi:hypothetical protein